MEYFKDNYGALYRGDVLEELKKLPDESVNMCVTSPPYWGLRDYGLKDQIGLENTPEEYIEKLVGIFREVRRVLKKDGTLWLNIGDSYYNHRGGKGQALVKQSLSKLQRDLPSICPRRANKLRGLKDKDLIGIPWMLAFALRADGWYLRQDNIWSKPNCQPECLDPKTKVFIKQNGLVNKISLDSLNKMKVLPEILTPSGWRPIKNIWSRLKSAMSFEVGKVERIICAPEHRFPVSNERRSTRSILQPALNIRYIGYKDYLLYCPIKPFLEAKIKNWDRFDLNYSVGYLLGVYTAEGGKDGLRGNAVKLTIGNHEKNFADKIRNTFHELLLSFSERVDGSALNFWFSSESWQSLLLAFIRGKVKNKRLNINLLLNTPECFRQGVLDGYIDGDGSYRQGGGWSVVSASRQLIRDISTLSSSLGIITSKGMQTVKDKRTGKIYRAWNLWTPYKTKRKEKEGMDGVYQIPPRRRKIVKNREMIDIEVEGGEFIIGDGLVTHNSVKDRCTKSHEYFFLLSKSKRYYYDYRSIREAAKPKGNKLRYKNKRSVWSVRLKPFRKAHFSVFPPELIKPCILAGCPEGGVVLDPFIGSGTTAVVSEDLNRKWLGVELGEKYCEMVEDRVIKNRSIFIEFNISLG